MRVVVFSDVHAILQAFDDFIAEATAAGAEVFWFLGDIIGYGPHPVAALERLYTLMKQDKRNCCVLGNHDCGVVQWHQRQEETGIQVGDQIISSDPFQPEARQINHIHADLLAEKVPDLLQWLAGLPLRAQPLPGFYLAHGSFAPDSDHNTVWTYGTKSSYVAKDQLKRLMKMAGAAMVSPSTETLAPVRLAAYGHYHVPALYRWDSQHQDLLVADPFAEEWFTFGDLTAAPVLINPGSISLPRPNAPYVQASYALLDIAEDGNTVQIGFRRFFYPWQSLLESISPGYPRYQELRAEIQAVGWPPPQLRED